MQIEPIGDIRCRLGEGPLWDAEGQALYWVDAPAARLHRVFWPSRETQTWELPSPNVGSLALRRDGGAVIAMDRGFYALDMQSGAATALAQVLDAPEPVRFNDGKTDRQGRFIAGSMDLDEGMSRPVGLAYQLATDLTPTRLLGGFTCFNGPCFSPDGETFYCTGRKPGSIEAFDYDIDDGAASNPRLLIGDDLNCDGATVDQDGCLWSAQWDHGTVLRITPDGRRDGQVDLPGWCVSSVMFGGPELDILFVTTVSAYAGSVADAPDSDSPDGGALLALHGTGHKGIAERRFAG